MFVQRIRIKNFEAGLVFWRGEFQKGLGVGTHWVPGVPGLMKVALYDCRRSWFTHEDLDQVIASGKLADMADFLDLKDHQRALVWENGRFCGIAKPGLHGFWKGFSEVRHEIVDTRQRRFDHTDLEVIVEGGVGVDALETRIVPEGHAGILLQAGQKPEVVGSGRHAFWKNTGPYALETVDTREVTHDVSGQEILTADKVSLRVNAQVTSQVTDPVLAVTRASDPGQALHRHVQMALRAVIGQRDLDEVLADKDRLVGELQSGVEERARTLGVEITQVGIRDIILPGQIREMMNKVVEARKSAEANLIRRREEVAAIRSQANTARIMEGNPTLMRLRELEVLQKISGNTRLEVVLGEKGLADRVINLL